MICNHAHECGSTECAHRGRHAPSAFCGQGYCRWAGDTECTMSTREQIEEVFSYVLSSNPHDVTAGVDRIMEIIEAKEGV